MRRMIPENQQEALRKLTSKEALLSLIEKVDSDSISAIQLNFDSDNETYLHISGYAIVQTADDSAFIEIENVPSGLLSTEAYPATNSEGGAGFVNVGYPNEELYPTRLRISFNEGTMSRTIYFSALLSKTLIDL